MRAIIVLAGIMIVGGARAEGCTSNHELYRVVPEYSAIMLDGGEIVRVAYLSGREDERLKAWKPGHNITYCPDQDKMINTTINSIAGLISKYSMTTCDTLATSNEIDRALEDAWRKANTPNISLLSVTRARSRLGWWYVVCTDHDALVIQQPEGLKEFLLSAESLTKVNMAVYDRANEATYKSRAAKYDGWWKALWEAEGKKPLAQRLWQRWFGE